jgi:chromosome segregation ATPase
MSEDKTEFPSNEDQTEEPEAPKTPTTNMMIETLVLEVREGFAEVRGSFAEVRESISQLNSKVATLTSEVKEIKRNQRVFNNQLLSIEGRLTDLEDERKSS